MFVTVFQCRSIVAIWPISACLSPGIGYVFTDLKSTPNNPPWCERPLMTLFPVCPRMCASTFFCQPERLVRYRIRPYSVIRKSQFSLKVQCVSCSLNIAQLRHMSSSCLPVRRRRRGCRRTPRRRGPSCRTPAGSDPCKEDHPHMTSTVL